MCGQPNLNPLSLALSLFLPSVSSPSTAAHRRNMATSYIEKHPRRVPVSVLDLMICVGQILLGGLYRRGLTVKLLS